MKIGYYQEKFSFIFSYYVRLMIMLNVMMAKPTWTRIHRGLAYSWTARGRHLPAWYRWQCQVERRRSSCWLQRECRPPGGSGPALVYCWCLGHSALPCSHAECCLPPRIDSYWICKNTTCNQGGWELNEPSSSRPLA